MKNKLLFLKPESSCYGNQSLTHHAGEWFQPQRCLQTWRLENRRQPGAARWWDAEMSTLTPPIPRRDASTPHMAAPRTSWLATRAPCFSFFLHPCCKDLSNCNDVKESFQDSGTPECSDIFVMSPKRGRGLAQFSFREGMGHEDQGCLLPKICKIPNAAGVS